MKMPMRLRFPAILEYMTGVIVLMVFGITLWIAWGTAKYLWPNPYAIGMLAMPCIFVALAITALRRHRKFAAWAFALAMFIGAALPHWPDTIGVYWVANMFTVRARTPLKFNTIDPRMAHENALRHEFHRLHFGFPFESVTVDVSKEGRGAAGIVELYAMIGNLGICLGMISILFFPVLWAAGIFMRFKSKRSKSSFNRA